MADLIKSCFP